MRLADRGYRSVACNLRGYSRGAAPDSPEEYHFIEKLVPESALWSACNSS